MITCMAFWTTRVYSVSQFFYMLVVLLSGQFVPLQLMPPVVQTIARILPFQMFRYVPIETILNRMSLTDVLINYAISLVWLIAFSFLFSWVWREGVKRFSAVGA
jgi:ABC-2 type transport system permease protein